MPPNRLHDLCDAACENCFEHPTDGNWVAWRWRLDEIFGPYFHSKVWFYAEISNEELVKLEKLAGPYGKVFYKVYLLNEGSEQRQRRK